MPTKEQKFQLSMSFSFGGNTNVLRLKQKNTETLQESEFQINPETDYNNLPADMRNYVDHFFKEISQFKSKINSRYQKVVQFENLAQVL